LLFFNPTYKHTQNLMNVNVKREIHALDVVYTIIIIISCCNKYTRFLGKKFLL
jgi:hypothetical protein